MRGHTYPEEKAVETVMARLDAIAEYRRLFAAAFGGGRSVTAASVGKALAAFQRTLTAANAPFDRYMRGDRGAMSDAQVRGMRRFERIGCVRCHNGPMFSDYKLHVLGVPDNPALPASDTGAGERGTGERYAFRTASLRNLAFTAPYMHSGIFATLEDVLEFYDDVDSRRGNDRNPNVGREELDPLLRQLRGVDEDDVDLIAFLEALSDPGFDRTIPARVPSGLPVGGRIQ
jgi:cytochrome c peroxidase